MLNIAPHRYVAHSGALSELGSNLESLGERALVIANKTALERFEDVIRSSLKESMIGVSFEICLGNCCLPEIERLSEEAQKNDADMIVGVGAGKTIDVAKYTAQKLDCGMVTVPSVASSYAAFSDLVYLYNEEGNFLELQILNQTPDLTLVDHKVVGLAPSNHLRAGMAPAIAVTYNIDISHDELSANISSRMAYEISQHLREVLFDHGIDALEDVKKGEVTNQVKKVIEANILEAGLISSLGGAKFRSMLANYFAVYIKPYTGEDVLFGDAIAFGLIAQELLGGKRKEKLVDLFSFIDEVGLPLSFDTLQLPENQRSVILEDAADNILTHLQDWDLNLDYTSESVKDSFIKADQLGQTVIQSGTEELF